MSCAAIEVIRELGLGGHVGIRLDSGDLVLLAMQSRALLDAAGLPDVRIFASGGLDEYALETIVRADAPIDGYGVGTKVGVCADAPYLDTAYKLVEYEQRPVFKLSARKATIPGRKQVFRAPGTVDRVGLRNQPLPVGTRPLLCQVMASGRRIETRGSLAQARQRCAAGLAQLDEAQRTLRDPVPLAVTLTAELREYAAAASAQPPATGPSGTQS